MNDKKRRGLRHPRGKDEVLGEPRGRLPRTQGMRTYLQGGVPPGAWELQVGEFQERSRVPAGPSQLRLPPCHAASTTETRFLQLWSLGVRGRASAWVQTHPSLASRASMCGQTDLSPGPRVLPHQDPPLWTHWTLVIS